MKKISSLSLLVNPLSFDQLTANLVLLGSISAVESYMREVIRKCIIIDVKCKTKCEIHNITYGAAISHKPELMPEAILEDVSFASKKNITDSLKDFLGIKGHIDSSLVSALNEFSKVCQIRHCLVHRYGKLGTKNAIALGLNSHSDSIEKPLSFNYTNLQECLAICSSLAKEVNNFVFKKILKRLICDDSNNDRKLTNIVWKWHYGQDRKLFKLYHDTLVSQVSNPGTHSNAREAYDLYKEFYESL